MIRIPFSADPHPADPLNHGHPSTSEMGEGSLLRETAIESRLAALELKLAIHAEELHSEVRGRVERIESRLENAVHYLGEKEGEPIEAENVVCFGGADSRPHHLHATNAKSALNELNETLHVTRQHLDALGASVARMRSAIETRSA